MELKLTSDIHLRIVQALKSIRVYRFYFPENSKINLAERITVTSAAPTMKVGYQLEAFHSYLEVSARSATQQ